LAFPSILYLITLTIFLFRPPDLDLYHADRIALGVLVFFIALRLLALRERLPFAAGLTLPMLGLAALAMLRALREPFDAQTWSLIASKFLVPLILFHVATLVFREISARRHFEIFVVLALAYLVFTAIAFLADSPALIFPRFILDESLGIHVDRARGPFLQAVANGLSVLNSALGDSVPPQAVTSRASAISGCTSAERAPGVLFSIMYGPLPGCCGMRQPPLRMRLRA